MMIIFRWKRKPYQEVVGHSDSKAMQFEHAFDLKVFNGVVVRAVFWL